MSEPRETMLAFLAERLSEEENGAIPSTVVASGDVGTHKSAMWTLNCIGPSGTGDCGSGWSLPVSAKEHATAEAQKTFRQKVRDHQMTHCTRQQSRVLNDVTAKRLIIEDLADHIRVYGNVPTEFGQGVRHGLVLAVSRLACAYDGHPDFDEMWRP